MSDDCISHAVTLASHYGKALWKTKSVFCNSSYYFISPWRVHQQLCLIISTCLTNVSNSSECNKMFSWFQEHLVPDQLVAPSRDIWSSHTMKPISAIKLHKQEEKRKWRHHTCILTCFIPLYIHWITRMWFHRAFNANIWNVYIIHLGRDNFNMVTCITL